MNHFRRWTGRRLALAVLTALTALPALAFPAVGRGADHPDLTIASEPMYLGNPTTAEWEWFSGNPQSDRWTTQIRFPDGFHRKTVTLFIRQDDVKLRWPILWNDRRLGDLVPMESPLWHAVEIPADLVDPTSNVLAIGPANGDDDVLLGPVLLRFKSLNEHLDAGLFLRLNDENGPVPGRFTVIDRGGALAPIVANAPAQQPSLAVRPGVVYTSAPDTTVDLRLAPGEYEIVAGRGFEWGQDRKSVKLEAGDEAALDFRIRREVDTRGWVACDPHTHTLTYSGHGDATLEERIITLAGEGIELPVATDHNILTDYAPAVKQLGLHRFMTPVIGAEVTTRQAHFNAFPIELGSRIPEFRILDWTRLLANIRGTPGVAVVILNHPHNVHNEFRPFDRIHFNPVTGGYRAPLDLNVDAMELLSSSAQQSDFMLVFNDWFSLLNRGVRITGLGSSDVHDVSRYIVGQGRTYVQVDDSDPGNIDVQAACRAVREGRALISMGLFVNLTVDHQFGVGDLATDLDDTISIHVDLRAPSWIKADKVTLFANGDPLFTIEFQPEAGGDPSPKAPDPIQKSVRWEMPRPIHDVYLVAMATGPGVSDLSWPIARPYQPASPRWRAAVVGATNPVRLDSDGDGAFSSPRDTARRLRTEFGPDLGSLIDRLGAFDRAVAVQAADLMRESGIDLSTDSLRAILDRSSVANFVRDAFDDVRTTADWSP